MGRRLVAAAMAMVISTLSACSYAVWPTRRAGAPPGMTPRFERCNTSKLAPHLDTVGAVYGGILLFGGGLVFVAELARKDEDTATIPDHDFVLGLSAAYVGVGWLMMTLYNRSRRYGYASAERCKVELRAAQLP